MNEDARNFFLPPIPGNSSRQGRDFVNSYPQVEDIHRRSSRSRRYSTSGKYSTAEEARPRKLSDVLPSINVSLIYLLYISWLWSRLLTKTGFPDKRTTVTQSNQEVRRRSPSWRHRQSTRISKPRPRIWGRNTRARA